jgi:hypothetical protein
MRIPIIVGLCAALGGCWSPGQDVTTSTRPGDQFVGKNVDTVVARFGNPGGRKKMDSDQMLYVWELAATELPANQRSYTGQGGLYGDGRTPGAMSDDPRICRISVTTSPDGVVTQFSAEDSNGTGAPRITSGAGNSVCAQRLSPRS